MTNLIVLLVIEDPMRSNCFGSADVDSHWSTYLSASVVCCFLIELSLRMVAQRSRRGYFNPQPPPAGVALSDLMPITPTLSPFTHRDLTPLYANLRFWRNPWNIFDLAVVSFSAAIICIQFIVIFGSLSVQEGFSKLTGATTALRAVSRVAMGLRIARVFLNLRKVSAALRCTRGQMVESSMPCKGIWAMHRLC